MPLEPVAIAIVKNMQLLSHANPLMLPGREPLVLPRPPNDESRPLFKPMVDMSRNRPSTAEFGVCKADLME
jgi:hypothetical protein